MKKLILFTALISLSGCQGGEADANPAGPTAQQSAGAAASPVRALSTASWSGGSSGQLRFDTASCIVMNGEIINFYAPAHAKDAIGEEPVLPQINGTKAGQGWAMNIMVTQGVTHSGGGSASAATSRTLTLSGDLLDGSSAARGAIGTVSANVVVECTDVDDLGTTR